MKTKSYFTFRVDVWDSAANSIVEQIAGIEDFEVAEATYWAAVARWPQTMQRGASIRCAALLWRLGRECNVSS